MIPNSFFQSFVVYGTNGTLDLKKSVKAFEEAFNEWIKEQGDIKPAILAELSEHERLGESKLVNFVLHRLRMKPGKENEDRIASALKELERSGRVAYRMTESGQRRGRGTGWSAVSGQVSS